VHVQRSSHSATIFFYILIIFGVKNKAEIIIAFSVIPFFFYDGENKSSPSRIKR
jgi:hypothetical protein